MGRSRAVVFLALTLALVGGSSGCGAAQSVSPKALYNALLTTAYPDSQLPSLWGAAKAGFLKPSAQAQKYHIVGEVQVSVGGPDPFDGLVYYVFPTAADARADLAHPHPSGFVKHWRVVGKVPGYSMPSQQVAGSITLKTIVGVTGLFVATGNVIVGASTVSVDHKDSGNMPAALAFLKSGLRHLSAVKKSLAHRPTTTATQAMPTPAQARTAERTAARFYGSTDPADCALLTLRGLAREFVKQVRKRGETALATCRRLVPTVHLLNIRTAVAVLEPSVVGVRVSYTYGPGAQKTVLGRCSTDKVTVRLVKGRWLIDGVTFSSKPPAARGCSH